MMSTPGSRHSIYGYALFSRREITALRDGARSLVAGKLLPGQIKKYKFEIYSNDAKSRLPRPVGMDTRDPHTRKQHQYLVRLFPGKCHGDVWSARKNLSPRARPHENGLNGLPRSEQLLTISRVIAGLCTGL